MSARLVVDGEPFLNFAGHGYLALSRRPELREAAEAALADCGFVQQLSPAYGATEWPFAEAEREAAEWAGREAAIYLPSGYLAGMVAMAALEPSPQRLFLDEWSHFCLRDAAALSGLPTHVFRHADSEALAYGLKAHLRPGERPAVLTDGCFATAGDIPPLAAYSALLEPLGGLLLVDEAHSAGVVGPTGRGGAELHGVADKPGTRLLTTLSKAFCAQGGAVTGDAAQIDRMRGVPPARGAAQGSPISAAVSAAALRLARAHPEWRREIAARADRLRRGLRSLGLETAETAAPIVAFRHGNSARMQAIAAGLFAQRIHLVVSNYIGSGPEGMIRCAVFRDHSDADIDALLDALAPLL